MSASGEERVTIIMVAVIRQSPTNRLNGEPEIFEVVELFDVDGSPEGRMNEGTDGGIK